MRHYRWILSLIAVGIISIALTGLARAQSNPGLPDTEIARKLDGFIHVDAVKRGFVGLLVQSLRDDRVLYSHDSTHLLVPASCMKLLVTSATLDALGPDFRTKTEVLASGESAGGALKGDLILKGYGDSSLDAKGLAEIADAVKAAGIKQVSGDLIADDSYFDGQRFGWGWSWDYEPASYAAPVGALVLNQNCTTVGLKAGKVGEPVQVSFEPPSTHFRMENNAKTSAAGAKSDIGAWRRRQTNVVTVSGQLAADSKPDQSTFSVDDPSLWVGDVFLQMLKERGIAVAGTLKCGTAPSGARVITAHQSESLSSLIETINRHSINVMAECLLKTLGAQVKGHGTYGAGIDAEEDFLKKIGVDPDDANIQDGSGLSRYDMVTPAALVAILRYMHKSPNAKVFLNSLPTAGGDGTLYLSMRKTAAEGNLTAKTGNLGWVQSIAGYVHTKSGEPLVFALIVNNYKCSEDDIYRMRSKIGVALAELP